MAPLFAHFDSSGIAEALSSGNTHVLIVGDSISASESNTRIPAGIMREWGVKTAPCVGVVCSRDSGVTDNYGRSFRGSSNSASLLFKPGPGVRIAVTNVVGTPVLGQTVTESVSGATGIFLQELTGEWWIAYDTTTNIVFTGGQTLTVSTSGATATGGAVVAMTADHLGLSMDIFPMPHVLQYATGDIGLSVPIYRSLTQNSNLFPQGDPWSSIACTARGIYYSHASAFNCKARAYRNATSVTSTNVNQQSADNAIKFTDVDLGSAADIPVHLKWEGLATSEVGQFTKFGGAMFYQTNATTGFTIDSVSVGGDGIASANDTTRSSDVHYVEYLVATKRPLATTLIVWIEYGQNDAGTSQATFEAELQLAITRYTTNGLAAGYTTVKFILVAPYNTGGTHLSGKRDACFNVSTGNSSVASFVNLYDLYTESFVAANTIDGIHPTLAFSQIIAGDVANEIQSKSRGVWSPGVWAPGVWAPGTWAQGTWKGAKP